MGSSHKTGSQKENPTKTTDQGITPRQQDLSNQTLTTGDEQREQKDAASPICLTTSATPVSSPAAPYHEFALQQASQTVKQHLAAGRSVWLTGTSGADQTMVIEEIIRWLREEKPGFPYIRVGAPLPHKDLLMALAQGLHELNLFCHPFVPQSPTATHPWSEIANGARSLKPYKLSTAVAACFGRREIVLILDRLDSSLKAADLVRLEETVKNAICLFAVACHDGQEKELSLPFLNNFAVVPVKRLPLPPRPILTKISMEPIEKEERVQMETQQKSAMPAPSSGPVLVPALGIFIVLLLLVSLILNVRTYSTVSMSLGALQQAAAQREQVSSPPQAAVATAAADNAGKELTDRDDLLAKARTLIAKLERRLDATQSVHAKLAQQLIAVQTLYAELEQRKADLLPSHLTAKKETPTGEGMSKPAAKAMASSAQPERPAAAASTPVKQITAADITVPLRGPYKRGSKGPAVIQIQQRLQDLGYYADDIDGNYGRGTRSAVRRFQRKEGLRADGILEGKTLKLLFSEGAKK